MFYEPHSIAMLALTSESKDSPYFLIPPPHPSVHPPKIFCQHQSFASVGTELLRIQPAGRQGREGGRKVLDKSQRKCNKTWLIILFFFLSFKKEPCPSQTMKVPAFTSKCKFRSHIRLGVNEINSKVFCQASILNLYIHSFQNVRNKKEQRHHWAQDRILREM